MSDSIVPAVEDYANYRLRVGVSVKERRVKHSIDGNRVTISYGFISVSPQVPSLDATYYNGTAAEVSKARRAVMAVAEQIRAGALKPQWVTARITTVAPDETTVEQQQTFEVHEEQAGSICREAACDDLGSFHEHDDEGPAHTIRVGDDVELSRYEGNKWTAFALDSDELTTAEQIDALIAQLTAARDRMQILNDRLAADCDDCFGKPAGTCTSCGITVAH